MSDLTENPAKPETASERPTGAAGSPSDDPIGTVRIGRDGRAVVKVSMGDETGKGQHVWVHVTQELEQRWFHHNEVAGLASERPDAGRERVIFAPSTDYVYVHDHVNDWWEAWERADDDRDGVGLETADLPKDAGPLFASDSPRPDLYAARLSVAERRASSWWEAAKALCRSDRDHHAEIADLTSRADAAVAKLAEAVEMVKTCTGHPDRALPDVPSHPELIQRANAERDEARAQLAEIRAVVDAIDPDDPAGADHVLTGIRAIVERPAAAPAEPAPRILLGVEAIAAEFARLQGAHPDANGASVGTEDIPTIYIGIGNSDDKLTQGEWRRFIAEVRRELTDHNARIIGEWFSLPDKPWQNAEFAFQAGAAVVAEIRACLIDLAPAFEQDSIAWAVATTEFLGADRG